MKTKISSYIQYLGANKFYRWVVSQKLSGDGFKWKKMKTLRKTMMKIMIKDIFLQQMSNILILHDLHSDLPFLLERIKINTYYKLVCNLYEKNNYAVHIKSLKKAIDHRLILRKVHKVIQFNQEAQLKECIDMNTELKKQAKNDFEKCFLN